MIALLSLLVVLSISLAAMRAGAVALSVTGMSQKAASFQAHSAFLGVGFTTRESEQVMRHPVRRRITMVLMFLGNAGVVASISTVLLVFVTTSVQLGWFERGLGLVVGLVALWVIFRSPWVDRHLTRLIEWALRHWTHLDVRDYVSLLHLAGEFSVGELEVRRGDWMAGRTLAELDLRSEGALVLGIERVDGAYVGVPRGPTRVRRDDTLIVYGRAALLDELDCGRLARRETEFTRPRSSNTNGRWTPITVIVQQGYQADANQRSARRRAKAAAHGRTTPRQRRSAGGGGAQRSPDTAS